MVLRPVYLALFSLSLLAVIAGSGAVMVLAGKGRDVFLFCSGMAVGMSLFSALSLELWSLSREQLEEMQAEIVQTIAALQLGELNPRLLLSQYRTQTIPHNADDVHLELECRRLLDRMNQLLAIAVSDDGYCYCCKRWGAHADSCTVLAAQQLYQQGKKKRVPWREYKKTLPADVVQ